MASIGALASQPDRVNTGQQWLKFLFSTKAAMIVNALEAFLVVLLNLYILFLFLGPLYTLLWYGQMTEQLVSLAVHLYEIIPLIVGLNMVWPKGYSLGNILRLLDVKVPSKDSESMRQAYMSLTKAVIALGSLLLMTLASMVSFEWKSANYYMTETRIDFYYHLLARFFLFLLIPVYLAIVSVSIAYLKDLFIWKATFSNRHIVNCRGFTAESGTIPVELLVEPMGHTQIVRFSNCSSPLC